jgi:hypothetical protein
MQKNSLLLENSTIEYSKGKKKLHQIISLLFLSFLALIFSLLSLNYFSLISHSSRLSNLFISPPLFLSLQFVLSFSSLSLINIYIHKHKCVCINHKGYYSKMYIILIVLSNCSSNVQQDKKVSSNLKVCHEFLPTLIFHSYHVFFPIFLILTLNFIVHSHLTNKITYHLAIVPSILLMFLSLSS